MSFCLRLQYALKEYVSMSFCLQLKYVLKEYVSMSFCLQLKYVSEEYVFMSFCLLTNIILYQAIFEMYRSICYMCEPFIVCNDNESLTELITEIEEELV